MDATQIALLLQPECFPHPVAKLELIETHISWVLLTGEWVYKIKKPVNFGFLDFSTLEKRQHCCQEEVRLNGRVGGDLYQGVVAICDGKQGLVIDGIGTVVDYAVKMRQFDPRATLQQILVTTTPAEAAFQQLGYQIGSFHQRVAVAPADSPWGSAEAVAYPVDENFHQIRERVAEVERALVAELAAQAGQALQTLKPVIEGRKRKGFVRELHGDLHAGNIALIDGQWVPFDCIEFNPNLRWIDTASDIAFLVMDLQFSGYVAQANCFLNAYLEFTGDFELLQMLNFYLQYRAMVRAKVAMLRCEQTRDPAERQQLLDSFWGHLRYCMSLRSRHAPCLVMMMGVSGSGKSTIARQIAARHDMIHVRSDAIRKALHGLYLHEHSTDALRPQMYSERSSDTVFSRMLEIARLLLDAGYGVIADATFIRLSRRLPFLTLAMKLGIPLVIVQCSASESVLAKRIVDRAQAQQDPSEADVAVMQNQLKHVEPLTAEEQQFGVEAAQEDWLTELDQRLARN